MTRRAQSEVADPSRSRAERESRTVPPPPEPTHPHPPRFRRLKRWTVFSAAVLLLLTGLRVWWGHEASRRLAAEVEAIRGRGEPLFPADFDPPPVPEAEDAVKAYRRAAGATVYTTAQQTFEANFEGSLPLTPGERRTLSGILATNRAALQQGRQARGLARRDGGGKVASPVASMPLGGLNPARELAMLAKWSALYAHAEGDDAEAIESARDVPALASALRREAPLLITCLVAMGIDAIGYDTVFQIAPDLQVEDAGAGLSPGASPATPMFPGPQPTRRPANREQVKALIAELLDDAAVREGMVRAWHGERMMALDSRPAFLKEVPVPFRVAAGPALDLDVIRVLRRLGQEAEAAGEPTFPAARARWPVLSQDAPAHVSRLEAVTRAVSGTYYRSGERVLDLHYQGLTERRMAAVALAVRLYRADHGGAWPRSLDELVPAYLPSVPADPFAPDGGPLRYRREAPGVDVTPAQAAAAAVTLPAPGTGPLLPGPVVYSVGEDGTDDGGSRRLDRRRRPRPYPWNFSFYRWDWEDPAVPLAHNPDFRTTGTPAIGSSGPAGASSPSGEAQDDDPDEGDGRGEGEQGKDGQQRPEQRQ